MKPRLKKRNSREYNDCTTGQLILSWSFKRLKSWMRNVAKKTETKPLLWEDLETLQHSYTGIDRQNRASQTVTHPTRASSVKYLDIYHLCSHKASSLLSVSLMLFFHLPHSSLDGIWHLNWQEPPPLQLPPKKIMYTQTSTHGHTCAYCQLMLT